MKNVLVLLAIMTTGLLASATSVDRTLVLATVSGSEQGLKQVALLADGRLQVVPEVGPVKQIKLTAAASEELSGLVKSLADVELNDVTYPTVCAMIPKPQLADLEISSFDYEKNKFNKKLVLILTAEGCAISHHVTPVDAGALVTASELRKALVVLALNTVADTKKQ